MIDCMVVVVVVVTRNTELMVWYGAVYGDWLGISTKDFFKPRLKGKQKLRKGKESHKLFYILTSTFLIIHLTSDFL